MTKRKNTFEEIPFLTKMHIGVKEVNLGVNAKENMKRVYDKTQKLLFLGASRLHYNGSINQCLSENNTCSSQNRPASGLNKEGISCHKCCLSNIKASCYFCEHSICSACSRVCQVCKHEFCQLCSLLKFSFAEVAAAIYEHLQINHKYNIIDVDMGCHEQNKEINIGVLWPSPSRFPPY